MCLFRHVRTVIHVDCLQAMRCGQLVSNCTVAWCLDTQGFYWDGGMRGGMGGGGVSVMWVCASLRCKARVSVYLCSCPMWFSGLLSVLPRCLTLMSVSYGFCGKEKNNKMVCVGVCVGS